MINHTYIVIATPVCSVCNHNLWYQSQFIKYPVAVLTGAKHLVVWCCGAVQILSDICLVVTCCQNTTTYSWKDSCMKILILYWETYSNGGGSLLQSACSRLQPDTGEILTAMLRCQLTLVTIIHDDFHWNDWQNYYQFSHWTQQDTVITIFVDFNLPIVKLDSLKTHLFC